MAAPKRLRVVDPNEKPARKPRKMTVTRAADAGTRRDYLVALRSRISTTLDNPDTSPRDLAALTRRAEQLDGEIRAIDLAAEQEGDGAEPTPDEAWDEQAL